MQPVAPTRFADDLRAIGLDPAALPPFASLGARERRRLMSAFTRSLGFACTDCHEADDFRAPTRNQRVTIRMWDEMTRPYALEGGTVFCDSCHNGQGRFLARVDQKAVGKFMSENFTGKLQRRGGKDVECETCHGDPFDGDFLAKW